MIAPTTPRPISLSDSAMTQLTQAMNVLATEDERAAFLTLVAQHLAAFDVCGDGDVYRAVVAAQRAVFKPPLVTDSESGHMAAGRTYRSTQAGWGEPDSKSDGQHVGHSDFA
jgi:hypothetical protein